MGKMGSLINYVSGSESVIHNENGMVNRSRMIVKIGYQKVRSVLCPLKRPHKLAVNFLRFLFCTAI